MGDVVVPEGAKFALPLPLLWQHRSDQPIGHVISASVTSQGIKIRAQIAKSGVLAEIDKAWTLIKEGLVRGLSIGFRATKDPEPIAGTWGVKFTDWEWLELSAVTIPANASASISTIKSLDLPYLAASGTSPAITQQVGKPRDRGAVVRLAEKGAPATMKTITEQITGFEATRQAKAAERDAIMNAAAEKGETLDTAEAEKYDGINAELASIDAHLKRLRDLDESNKAAAVTVKGADPEQASQSRGGNSTVVTFRETPQPGIGLARVVLCKMASFLELQRGNAVSAHEIAQKRYPHDPRVAMHIKATVAAGTTTDTNWATELVEPTTLASEFVEYLRKMTVIGKLNLRRLPFNIRIPRQTTGGSGYWVGEGKPKPLTNFNFDAVTLPYTKVAAISVITQELARFSNPSAEAIVRDQLAAACVERIDTDLLDPDKAVSSGVNPASLTNGLTALSSAGTAAANVITDVQNLLEQFILNNQSPANVVLVMPNTLALAASLMITTNGVRQFDGLTLNGGTLLGIPVITSQYAASSASYGNMVIAIDQSAVGLADDGAVSVEVSTEASLEMLDSGFTQNQPTGASLVSLWQNNLIGIRAERFIHWTKLRSTAVVFMDDVNWGSIGSPS